MTNYDLDNYHGDFRRYFDLKLPSFMTVDMWRRHGYSLTDIRTTLKYFTANDLWQCALHLGIQMSGSSIRLSFSSPVSMVFGSKSIAIKKIMHKAESFGFGHTNSVLDTSHEDHIPPLPVHTLDRKAWSEMMALFHNRPINYLGVNEFDGTFEWGRVLFLPLWREDEAIYAVRVVREFHSSVTSLATSPIDFDVRGERMFGVEESCFFVRAKKPIVVSEKKQSENECSGS